MSILLNNPTLALFFLQSNDAIGKAIDNGGLAPDLSQYTDLIIGTFGKIFLIAITAIGSLVHNYGWAIILTALLVRISLLYLTRMQIRGMKMMQQLQPVMKEIQRHYPDKQDQSAKTMELYSEYKINPLSGCLPMLIQFPILFGVYRALYDASFAGKDFFGIQLLFPVNLTSGRSFGVGPELRDLVDVTVEQFGLHSHLWQLPDGIPLIGGSIWYLPALILVVFYVGSSLWMQRVMRKVNAPDKKFVEEFEEVMKSKKRNEEESKEPDFAQQMQKQMGFMNFIIIIFAFIFSAGALLYFIVQNLLMIAEYTLIPKYAGGNGLELDAVDMKKFIRRPPKPIGQPTAVPKAGDADKSPDGGAKNTEQSQVDVTMNGEEEGLPLGIKRPRKKRRKR